MTGAECGGVAEQARPNKADELEQIRQTVLDRGRGEQQQVARTQRARQPRRSAAGVLEPVRLVGDHQIPALRGQLGRQSLPARREIGETSKDRWQPISTRWRATSAHTREAALPDTSVAVWLLLRDRKRLSTDAVQALEDADNEVALRIFYGRMRI